MSEGHSVLVTLAALAIVWLWRLSAEKGLNPMRNLRTWPWRIRTWVIMRLRLLQCLLVGHNYAQHFNELFRGTWPDETPWCDNCGKDVP